MKINKHNFKKDAKDSNETKEQKVKLTLKLSLFIV